MPRVGAAATSTNTSALAVIALRVLTKITADPEPFPPALVASGHKMIRYEAIFGIE